MTEGEGDAAVAGVVITETAPARRVKTRKKTRQTNSSSLAQAKVHSPAPITSSCASSESGQSDGGTEDDPISHVTPSAGPTAIPHSIVDFSSLNSILSDSADLNDEERVDTTPIPPTTLESAPPTAFPPHHLQEQIVQQREEQGT